ENSGVLHSRFAWTEGLLIDDRYHRGDGSGVDPETEPNHTGGLCVGRVRGEPAPRPRAWTEAPRRGAPDSGRGLGFSGVPGSPGDAPRDGAGTRPEPGRPDRGSTGERRSPGARLRAARRSSHARRRPHAVPGTRIRERAAPVRGRPRPRAIEAEPRSAGTAAGRYPRPFPHRTAERATGARHR